jgi:polyketide cyclase/dehydrase/lipid transport protein
MAVVVKHIKARPAAVYAVLADGWDYSQWVVGTSHVRAVDASWPAPGSRLHHAVGAWPFVLRDHTVMREAEQDRRLLMTARGWPVGEAEVEIILEPEGDGTRLMMREAGIGGAGWLLRNPVGEALVYRRNVESVARLAALVERRTSPTEESSGGA